MRIDRSTIKSPTIRSWTQITQGVRAEIEQLRATTLHNHDPPYLTGGPWFR